LSLWTVNKPIAVNNFKLGQSHNQKIVYKKEKDLIYCTYSPLETVLTKSKGINRKGRPWRDIFGSR